MIKIRSYENPGDFKMIGDFLIEHYEPGNGDGNWLQPAWEYMHSHPSLDESAFDRIGVWEDSGEIIGVVHYETELGEAFFEIHPQHVHLKSEMLDYAEKRLYGTDKVGRRFLRLFIKDSDGEFETIVRSRGYEKTADRNRPMSQFKIPDSFPQIRLQDDFILKSLLEDNDLLKIHRVLWRGFDHPGEPPGEELEGRRKMQSGPNFRKDLNIIIEAPDGNFVAYCGKWYDDINKIAYVEPVATDPDFHRMGLGKAAVLEGIRRCVELEATEAFVGSDKKFYTAIGFEKIHTSNCWTKFFDE